MTCVGRPWFALNAPIEKHAKSVGLGHHGRIADDLIGCCCAPYGWEFETKDHRPALCAEVAR
jgi:hypothetical protein